MVSNCGIEYPSKSRLGKDLEGVVGRAAKSNDREGSHRVEFWVRSSFPESASARAKKRRTIAGIESLVVFCVVVFLCVRTISSFLFQFVAAGASFVKAKQCNRLVGIATLNFEFNFLRDHIVAHCRTRAKGGNDADIWQSYPIISVQ